MPYKQSPHLDIVEHWLDEANDLQPPSGFTADQCIALAQINATLHLAHEVSQVSAVIAVAAGV